MPERTKESGSHSEHGEYIEVSVVFHAAVVKVRIRKGATIKELIKAVREAAEKEGIVLGSFDDWTITINGRQVKIKEDQNGAVSVMQIADEFGGECDLSEEVVEENTVIVLTKRVQGGFFPACAVI